jgi:hypothetical protein
MRALHSRIVLLLSLAVLCTRLHAFANLHTRRAMSAVARVKMVATGSSAVFEALQVKAKLEPAQMRRLASIGRVLDLPQNEGVSSHAGGTELVHFVLNGTVMLLYNEDGQITVPVQNGSCFDEGT